MTTCDRLRAIRLAKLAFQAARDRDLARVAAVVDAVVEQCGPDGLRIAVQVWTDCYINHAHDGQNPIGVTPHLVAYGHADAGEPHTVTFVRADTGQTLDADGDDDALWRRVAALPDAQWAARVLHARVSDDPGALDLALRGVSLPNLGRYLSLAVLSWGTAVARLPRGFAAFQGSLAR